MQKLALKPEALCVESFEVAEAARDARGTVQGEEVDVLIATRPWEGCTRTCPPD